MSSVRCALHTGLLVPLILVACTQPGLRRPPDGHSELSVVELKAIYDGEADPRRKFGALAAVVRRYASQSLNSDEARDAQLQASELMRMAPNFESDWNYGGAIHHSNLVLGRVRLMGGDVVGAGRYLIKAAEISGSPELSQFGPNMTLAKELLVKGQRDVVLTYLDRVQKFWSETYSKGPLRDWRRTIAEGKIPDFGPNLSY